MALCVAFALGPLTGGAIIEVLNFEYLLLICGVINLGTNFKLSTFFTEKCNTFDCVDLKS